MIEPAANIDPVTTSIIQHRLSAIVAEMGEAMLRTSYSQILNSSRDFSMALCGADGGLLAQAEHIPVHVGAMSWAAKEVIEYFKDGIYPGDVFLLNDPYFGGSHLPDVTAIVPVFVDGACRYWTLNRAHHSDIGGATHGAYNAAATEIWQEGLRIPPIKLYDKGERRDDIHRMLAVNVRHPRDFEGDLAAQIGSVKLGEKRVTELIAEFGGATVALASAEILNAAERQARAVIQTWKDGVYHGSALMDDDGRGNLDITIRAKVTILGDEIEIDLSDSDPQVDSYINSSFANMQSSVVMSYAFLLDPGIAQNAGTIRPLTIKAKQGTVVWANDGAPVTFCTSHCSQDITEAIIDAIEPACPDRTMAGWGKRFRIAIKGADPRNGAPFIWHMFHARPGAGASSGGDGWHNSGEWHTAGGLKFGSVEVAEARFPLFFERHEFRPGSGGDGEFLGGAGCTMAMRLETKMDSIVNTAGEGVRHGTAGRAGGGDGAPHDYQVVTVTGERTVLSTKEEGVVVEPGVTFEILSGGGGGWGNPADRSQTARENDGRNGLLPYKSKAT